MAPSTDAELRALSSTLHLDAPVVRRFIGDYLRLLDTRVARIEHSLEADDLSTATIALLSLATSSSMVGADDVAEAADQLRLRVAAGNATAIEAGRRRLISRVRQAGLRLADIEADGGNRTNGSGGSGGSGTSDSQGARR
ncbi:hypothetical protein FOE78_03065 [Microlunatus elymi]|uniref:Hpt domain-containing protein n=1 Tax=Microlunatus elymi TaxID=2596828 RepID=A0A516PV39_9ACTN|nr:hypothetical protein [Microlunatus elymi]QDP95029.1 hypothetical protein FOE78_03065 [Microlunatus elymi]